MLRRSAKVFKPQKWSCGAKRRNSIFGVDFVPKLQKQTIPDIYLFFPYNRNI
ncbi:hypothetical protein APA_3695 [Pseudanabaena sp. lw0831]|nr:hypothetical protein APA_3695 [Pseudanabaena sp. lw0831]